MVKSPSCISLRPNASDELVAYNWLPLTHGGHATLLHRIVRVLEASNVLGIEPGLAVSVVSIRSLTSIIV